jgi:hypothetical protein
MALFYKLADARAEHIGISVLLAGGKDIILNHPPEMSSADR